MTPDGRLSSGNEPAPDELPWSPYDQTFDAAGLQSASTQTTSSQFQDPLGINHVTTIQLDRANTFDGNGALIKLAETTTVNSGTPGTVSTYYLRSTVTGNVLAEYDNTGLKRKSNVYAGNQLVAQQLTDSTTTTMLWQHLNPVTGDGVNTFTNGQSSQITRVDPYGMNMPDADPFSGPMPGPGEVAGQGMGQSMMGNLVGEYFGGGGYPMCVVNGVAGGCHVAGIMLGNGSGEWATAANSGQARIYSNADQRYVGFASFNGDQAAQGRSVFGLPAGWAPAGMTFSGSGSSAGWTLSSDFATSDFAGAALIDLIRQGYSGLAGYAAELFGSQSATAGQVNELSNAYVAESSFSTAPGLSNLVEHERALNPFLKQIADFVSLTSFNRIQSISSCRDFFTTVNKDALSILEPSNPSVKLTVGLSYVTPQGKTRLFDSANTAAMTVNGENSNGDRLASGTVTINAIGAFFTGHTANGIDITTIGSIKGMSLDDVRELIKLHEDTHVVDTQGRYNDGTNSNAPLNTILRTKCFPGK